MAKINKLEALRRGLAIEDSPGIYAKLDPETKSIRYSTGEVEYVGDNPNYFPKDERQKRTVKEKEKIEKEISDFPFGKDAGEFLYQFGQKSSAIGGIGDWVERLTSTGEDYLSRKEAKREVSSNISEKRPYLSGGASVASLIPDFYLTRGMSATKAVPTLTALGAGSKVLDEPGEVALESAMGAGAGFFLDKGTQFLSRMASRRGKARDITKQAEEISERNIRGLADTEAENVAARGVFEKEKEFIQRQNQARQHQFNLEVAEKENEMVQAKNAYELAKANHLAETESLKKGYEVAQSEYKEALKNVPVRQREAQKAISDKASKYYDSIVEQLPENTTINTSQLNPTKFIDENVRVSAIGATKEGKEVSRVIESLFREGEEITGKEMANRLRILDEIIETSSRDVKIPLDQFKRSIGVSLRDVIADNVIYSEMSPILLQSIKSDIRSSFHDFNPHPFLGQKKSELLKTVQKNAEDAIAGMNPNEFISKLRSGTLSSELINKTVPKEMFVRESFGVPGEKGSVSLTNLPVFRETNKQYQNLINSLAENIENSLSNAEVKAFQAASKVKRNTSRRFREAYGIAEDVKPPLAPQSPDMPMAPLPPERQALPPKPVPEGFPSPPQQKSFTPEAVPSLSPAQGIVERGADFLERPMSELLKGKGPFNTGTLGKLAGLKYLAGAKTAPFIGAYGAAKALTSPGMGGQYLRGGIQRGGIGAIVQTISTYPSYENGVLRDPKDRTFAVSEIEQDPDLGITEKAMLQTYINRGKSLEKLGEIYGR